MLIGILSDAHGHIGAFETALMLLRRAGAERLIFLGDSVGYIPEPGVADRLRKLDILTLSGNHEAMMFSSDYPQEHENIFQLQATRMQMKEATRDYLRGLKPCENQTIDNVKCMFVHGSPLDPVYGYVYPDTDLMPFGDISADVIFMGQTHRPFVRCQGSKQFVNVGSCALPRDDDPRGATCLFDTASGEASILRFDIADTSSQVLANYSLHESVANILQRTTGSISHA